MRDYIVFDTETSRTTREVQALLNLKSDREAFAYPHRMGFGVGVVWDSKEQEFSTFKDAKKMAEKLMNFDGVLVSFNGIRFDIPVFLPYIDIDWFFKLQQKPHLDMLKDFYDRVNGRFRVPLNNIAKQSCGVEKSGSGADAPFLFKQGRFKELIEYCQQDVEVTKQVFLYGLKNGFIKYWDRQNQLGTQMEVDYKAYLE